MKRWTMMLALLLTLFVLPAQAQHASIERCTVELYAAKVSFDLPQEVLCLTRETSASVFNRWGLSQREVLAYMESCDMYAMLIDPETGSEMQLVAFPWEGEDYDSLTDAQAMQELEGVGSSLRQIGGEVLSIGWEQRSGHAFILAESTFAYEDGCVENELAYYTRQAGYDVQLFVYGGESGLTDAIREAARQLVDSLVVTATQSYVPDDAFGVKTENLGDGRVRLTMPGTALTFLPMNARYVATRNSSEVAFANMGYMRKKTLREMEANAIYAVLMNDDAQVELHVSLRGMRRAPDYAQLSDARICELATAFYQEQGWTVDRTESFPCGEAKFVRSILSIAGADGGTSQYVTYLTCANECWIEITVYAMDGQMLEKYAEETDAFVRSMQIE